MAYSNNCEKVATTVDHVIQEKSCPPYLDIFQNQMASIWSAQNNFLLTPSVFGAEAEISWLLF